ncbi:MAG: GNAT family N-acetyltransferase [Ilumatobacteraceae bacterium]
MPSPQPDVVLTEPEIGVMTAAELALIVDWAAGEQWNPGLHDVAAAHAYDPEGFVAMRRDGEMIGGGSIVSYDGAFGFMGLFIVRPDLRGHGLGTQLWHHRRDRLLARLRPGAAIGMDGVFAMVPFYERGGFRLAYRDLRFEGVAPAATTDGLTTLDLVPLDQVPFDVVPFDVLDAYDRRHVAAPRTALLRHWLDQPGSHGAAVVEDGRVVGMAHLRPCRTGFKFGPVHADRADIAERLIAGLLAKVVGEQVQLDVPEPNEAGLALAARFGMAESFGCARMYLGPDPDLPVDRIFGVTSFEFG